LSCLLRDSAASKTGRQLLRKNDQGVFVSMGGYPPFRLPKTRQRAEIRQALSYKTHRPFPTNAGAMGRYSGFVQSGPWLAKSVARVADRAA
ncbi:hypothetical protein, partial [Pseudomonas helleri]|uniref:hypothetical protein n=2 Tax=Pseudomonas helleri TaxID=1608996 RepID=UPI003340BD7C